VRLAWLRVAAAVAPSVSPARLVAGDRPRRAVDWFAGLQGRARPRQLTGHDAGDGSVDYELSVIDRRL